MKSGYSERTNARKPVAGLNAVSEFVIVPSLCEATRFKQSPVTGLWLLTLPVFLQTEAQLYGRARSMFAAARARVYLIAPQL